MTRLDGADCDGDGRCINPLCARHGIEWTTMNSERNPMTTDLAQRTRPTRRRRRDDDLCPICGYPGGSPLDHIDDTDHRLSHGRVIELGTPCDGDGRCTNPRCQRHGITWNPEVAGSVGAGEDGTVTP